jgi:hypothetical protein
MNENIVNINELDAYTPSSLMEIFNNSLNISAINKIINIKGTYTKNNSKLYGNYYYDQLKDEIGNKKIKLLVPWEIRDELIENHTYIFRGYFNKKVTEESSIGLNFCIIELITNLGQRMSKEELRTFDIRSKKVNTGYRDLTPIIENKLLNNEEVKIALIIGNNSIIESDINSELSDSSSRYNIDVHSINLSSVNEIVNKLNELNNDKYDAVVVSRGGGSGLDVFDNTEVSEVAINMKPIVITAIGHAEDNNLLQEIADKKFATPSAFGSYLRDIDQKVTRTIYERSVLINDYEDRINEKNNEIAKLHDEISNHQKAYDSKLEEMSNKMDEKAKESQKQSYIMLIIGLIIGVILKFIV